MCHTAAEAQLVGAGWGTPSIQFMVQSVVDAIRQACTASLALWKTGSQAVVQVQTRGACMAQTVVFCRWLCAKSSVTLQCKKVHAAPETPSAFLVQHLLSHLNGHELRHVGGVHRNCTTGMQLEATEGKCYICSGKCYTASGYYSLSAILKLRIACAYAGLPSV